MKYNMTYNDIAGNDIGALVIRRPNIPAPSPKITQVSIPGRDGDLLIDDGFFDDIEIYVELNFMAPENEWNKKTRQIKSWLLSRRGARRLSFSDTEDTFYKVKNVIVGEIQRTSKRIGAITPAFVCDPYTYFKSGAIPLPLEEVKLNPYNLSKPVYSIEGEKAGVLTVNGHEIKINVGQNLTIDTNLMITYRQDRTLQNTAITGNYEDMYLLPGENTIEITEELNLMVTPNWRVL